MALTRPRAEQIYNLDYKQATRVVTIVDITLAGGAPNNVDGVNLTLGDRILVTGQADSSQNGLYDVYTLGTGSNGTWVRTSDANATGEIEAGMIIMVTEGQVFADTQWKLITDNPIIIGTTGLVFTQNYLANSISAGTSNVVVAGNANVTVSSSGVANVLTISPTGAYVAGIVSATGNIYAGNISVSGNITGNISFDQSISVSGNVQANYYFGNGSQLTGIQAGNIVGGYSNANVYQFLESGNSVSISITGNISTTGNILAGNISVSGNIIGNVSFDQSISASGNVLAGNIVSTGNIIQSGTGNINGYNGYFSNNLTVIGTLTSTSNIIGGLSGVFYGNSVTGNMALYAGIPQFTPLGSNVVAQFSGNVNSYSQINFQNISDGTNATTEIIITADNGNDLAHFGDFGIAGSNYANAIPDNDLGTAVAPNDVYLYAQGNADGGGGNLVLGSNEKNGVVRIIADGSNTANVVATFANGGVNVTGIVSASGNITGNYIIGNGSQLTGINYSNIVGAYSNANVANYLPTYSGNLTAGNTSVSGNAISGNILTAGQISAAGNITGNNFLMYGSGNILGNLNVQGNITFIDSNVIVTNDLYIDLANNQSTYANVNGAGLNVGNTGSAPLVRWTYNTAANAWTTNVGISATGNITANTGSFFIGNGSQLTGITANSIVGSYSNANVIALGESGWAGNIIPAGNGVYDLGSETNTWRTLYLSANTLNIGGGNLSVSNGNLLFNGNVVTVQQGTTGNIVANNISLAGNAVASYFVGDGSYLTNINAGNITGGYGNANVYQFLQSGNSVSISTTGNISTAGNIIGNNLIANNSVNWSNNGAPAVYQLYNASTGSLDTIFV